MPINSVNAVALKVHACLPVPELLDYRVTNALASTPQHARTLDRLLF
jgi:hypothetical protein